MATKKKEEPLTNSNINTNTNNINVNVKVERPKAKKANTAKQSKPHWVKKAVVIAVIGLIASIAGFFIKKHFSSPHKPAVIKDHSQSVSGNKTN